MLLLVTLWGPVHVTIWWVCCSTILRNSSFTKIKVQSLYNPNFGSIGMDHVMSELCYIETILQRNYRKMIYHDHFPIDPL